MGARGEDEMEEESKMHFILVHGIGHGAWCWYKLATLLTSAGHRVTAFDLAASGVHPKNLHELRSFTDYCEPLMETMASIPPDDRVILVGHSFGGICIALAMEKFPAKVSVAVFATGVMPSTTTPVSDIVKEFYRRHPLEAYMDSKVMISTDPKNSSSFLHFGPKYMLSKMYQLTAPEDFMLATMLVRPGSLFLDHITKEAMITEENFGSLSRVYIVCKEDKSMIEDFQRWMIERSPGTEVKEIEGADHMVMLSKTKELYSLLLDIAKEHH
ncbi:norfluorocurarine synthase 2 [Elaeis guineensis]|uniref:Salicylic acid-binding protein 2 n=1 Tax=Elaeis guineensis var. tenera TaxID=51953 RepID=A0A6I9S6Q0_ELAGV|nr:salicylic acid-binding protein 2 [Elaeis guineensis]